jgi:hypothetical protein
MCYLEKDILKQLRESCPISRRFQSKGSSLTPHTLNIPCDLLRIIQIGWNSIQMLEKKFQRIFLLKKHARVRMTVYVDAGSESVASRIAMELILEIRYMIRSLGMALDGL